MDNIELNQKYKFVVHTFGCKVNTYDTGLIQKNLIQNGFSASKVLPKNFIKSNNENLDQTQFPIHVLNTCAVTAEATQQAVRLIRKIKSTQPLATVVVTGCAAQVDTGAFENLPGANLVVANSHKGILPQILDQYFKQGQPTQKVFKSNIFKKDDLEMGGGEETNHTRSFLKIQDGCNSFCSFCIIPYARGKSRSIPILDLVRQIKSLESTGVKEVVLTGVHIGDYLDESFNKKQTLEDLVESVLTKTSISRLRLSSLEPIEISERLLDLFSDSRLCPHFHMSIQSADTIVLNEMKRHYSEKEVRSSLDWIQNKVPGSFVGMDVIAGFPTETQEQFENTYKVLSESPWTKLHVFPYSERKGTRAEILPQVPMMQRKERASLLRSLSDHRNQAEALKQIGSVKKTLILNGFGLSRDYWNIQLNVNPEQLAQIKNTETLVKIESVDLENKDLSLKGQIQL